MAASGGGGLGALAGAEQRGALPRASGRPKICRQHATMLPVAHGRLGHLRIGAWGLHIAGEGVAKKGQAARNLTFLYLLFLALLLGGCGPSLDTLNRMAANGFINDNAPVRARLELQIAAPASKVWALLVDAPSWPKWQKQIESVTAEGRLRQGMQFSWKTGGVSVHSQVQLFDSERQLAWTGTALTAKAIHVWQLKAQPGNQTLVTVKESMDGLLMAHIFPSEKLAESEKQWALALKKAAEASP